MTLAGFLHNSLSKKLLTFIPWNQMQATVTWHALHPVCFKASWVISPNWEQCQITVIEMTQDEWYLPSHFPKHKLINLSPRLCGICTTAQAWFHLVHPPVFESAIKHSHAGRREENIITTNVLVSSGIWGMSFRSDSHSLIRSAVFCFNQGAQSLADVSGYNAQLWPNLSRSHFTAFSVFNLRCCQSRRGLIAAVFDSVFLRN